jgi:hypothetical protein
MANVKHTIIGFITCMVFGTILFGGAKMAVNAANISPKPAPIIEQVDDVTVDNTDVDSTDLVMTQYRNDFNDARDALAIEVYEYITSVAPKAEIDPYILIDLCNQYNIDIAFVLAQGQIESHYATKGTAKRTNSIFNVGAYDGHSAEKQRKNGFGFEDPNDSIEPYLILLTNDYLVNGKTINDLMVNYVNYLDMRYASNSKYESQIKSVYNKIYRNPEFRMAYEEYKECWVKIC